MSAAVFTQPFEYLLLFIYFLCLFFFFVVTTANREQWEISDLAKNINNNNVFRARNSFISCDALIPDDPGCRHLVRFSGGVLRYSNGGRFVARGMKYIFSRRSSIICTSILKLRISNVLLRNVSLPIYYFKFTKRPFGVNRFLLPAIAYNIRS